MAKKSKLKAALKHTKQAHAKHQAAKRTQDQIEQKLASATQSKRGNKKKHKRTAYFPYTDKDLILLVGEGNFSFAHAVARRLGSGKNITATAYDSREIVDRKYTDDASHHITEFEKLGGTTHYEVDGTALEDFEALSGRKFTHIVFNFPHAGAGIKDQARNIQTNQLLMIGFFRSAIQFLTEGVDTRQSRPQRRQRRRPKGDQSDDDDEEEDEQQQESFDFEGAKAHVVTYAASDDEDDEGPVEDAGEGEPFEPNLNRPGQILVSLKSGPPYSHWNVRQLAKECGLRARSTHPFEIAAYPGYEHRRTLGFKEGLSKDENQEIRDKEPHVYTFVAKPRQEEEGDDNAESASAPTGYTSQARGKRSLGVNSESFDGMSAPSKKRRR
ncbi:hypothetical protein DL89DRAFT_270476 [Linderina pennispora]|uniref:25S rRNA (uridine-N(3))-methyltransferase BMT5-like domain-containing protein n=1 Tax=Linderina pennispora TaxID=61395 RepID=A0A1Y1VXB3_9FUNG|nr:uncharacterized protein DL89DRAFT_270476 [Linderina pennispora]ORX65912.1 hypothetical protein DL89DRAFT_270476 [Linderina pennispora]